MPSLGLHPHPAFDLGMLNRIMKITTLQHLDNEGQASAGVAQVDKTFFKLRTHVDPISFE